MTPVTYADFAHRCWRFLFRAGAAGIPQLSLDDISSGLGAGEARVRHAVQTLLTHELVDEAVVDGVSLYRARPYRDDEREALRVRLINRVTLKKGGSQT